MGTLRGGRSRAACLLGLMSMLFATSHAWAGGTEELTEIPVGTQEVATICSPSGAGASGDPVLIAVGASIEEDVDVYLPGTAMPYQHKRIYNSGLQAQNPTSNPLAAVQGERWQTDPVGLFLTFSSTGGGGREVVMYGAYNSRTFTSAVSSGPLDPPSDLAASQLVPNAGKTEYTFTDYQVGTVYTFHGDSATPTSKRGVLKSIANRYGESIDFTFNSSAGGGGGRITQALTSQGWKIVYQYQTSGVNAGRLNSISVYNGSNQYIQRVLYTYFQSGSGYSPDVGTAGDLIQVRNYRRDSGDNLGSSSQTEFSIHRVIQYRYDSNHRLRHVLQPGDVAKIIADNGTVTSSSDILKKADSFVVASSRDIEDYASRTYEYYSSNADTTSITTDFGGTNENLESAYNWSSSSNSANETANGGHVHKEIIRGNAVHPGEYCGNGVSRVYYYMDVSGADTADPNVVSRIVVEDTVDGNGDAVRRTVFGLSGRGVKLRDVIIDQPASSKYWCLSRIFGTGGDENLMTEERQPSVHTGVDTATELNKFLHPTQNSGANDSDTYHDDDGVVLEFEYETSGLTNAVKIREGGDASNDAHYLRAATYGDGTTVPLWLTTKTYHYPTRETVKTNGVETEYLYTFYDATVGSIKTIETRHASISGAQNGPDAGAKSYIYFDSAGRLRWHKNRVGTIYYYAQHPDTGGIAYVMSDVDTSSLPADITAGSSNWIEWDDGSGGDTVPTNFTSTNTSLLEMVRKTEYDDLGRATKRETPGEVETYFVYEGDPDGNDRILAFMAWDSGSNQPLVPITVIEADKYGRAQEAYEVKASRTSASGGLPVGLSAGTTQAHYTAWTKMAYNFDGMLAYTDQYRTIPSSGAGTLGTHYYRDRYEYDTFGHTTRLIKFVDGIGTGTNGDGTGNSVEQIEDYVYDVHHRLTSISRGVSDAAHDISTESDPTLKTIASRYYDEAIPGSGSSGVGDGRLTSYRNYYDASNENNYSQVTMHRDWRGRVRALATETAPYVVFDVDWQDRVTAVASFKAAPNWALVLASTTFAADTTSNRASLSVYEIDDLGRRYHTEVHDIDQTDGDTEGKVVTDLYYDLGGRLVAATSPGLGAREIAYDGIGRVAEKRFVTELVATKFDGSDNFDYVAPEPGATTGGNDGVLTLDRYVYSADSKVLDFHHYRIHHDDTDGINLSSGSEDYVRTTHYKWFDGANRVTTKTFYGTGHSGGLWTYATIPARPGTTPASSNSDRLVSKFTYNDQGFTETVTDRNGNDTDYTYDALGRLIRRVDASGQTESRSMLTVYNGWSRTVKIIADLDEDGEDSSGDQVTEYLFEDDYHTSLATKIVYPDSTNSTWDVHAYSYTLDGRVATYTKPKKLTGDTATVVTFDYDDSRRRRTKERVTTLGTGINGDVRSIVYTYSTRGLLEKVGSYASTDGTGTPLNEVQTDYDSLGRVLRHYQAHDGAVATASSPKIEYTYDSTKDVDSVYTNNRRLTEVAYPGGSFELGYDYGTASSLEDKISRLAKLQDVTGTPADLVAYDMDGTGRVMETNYASPDVRMSYHQGDSNGVYEGIDRFGRTIDHYWEGYNSTNDVDRFGYSYDYNGNAITRDIDSGIYASNDRDQKLTYDKNDRIVDMDEGTLSGGSISGTPTRSRTWSLDDLGNWTGYEEAAAGTTTLDQTRNYDDFNEIDSFTNSVGGSWVTPEYDANGNMTVAPSPTSPNTQYDITYDAWNRVAKVHNATASTDLADYEYDGFGRRIEKRTSSTDTDYYHNAGRQVLEVWEDEDDVDTEGPRDTLVWHFGGSFSPAVRYYDADSDGTGIVKHFHTTDAIGNVTAIVDENGTVLERYLYDTYGNVTFLDGSFGSRSASQHGQELLFAGYRFDTETGLYCIGARVYHPRLGRWLQRDNAMQFIDGLNLYEYVRSNPSRWVDPFGTLSLEGTWAGDFIDDVGEFYDDANEFKDGFQDGVGEEALDTLTGIPKLILQLINDPGSVLDGLKDALKELESLLSGEMTWQEAIAFFDEDLARILFCWGQLSMRERGRLLGKLLVRHGATIIGLIAGGAGVGNIVRSMADKITKRLRKGGRRGRGRGGPGRAGPDGNGPGCFVKGTLVATVAMGMLAIENVAVGQEVWAYNHESSQWEACVVEQVFEKEVQTDIVGVTLTFEDGSISDTPIEATGSHPFWVASAVDMAELAERPLALEHAGTDAAYVSAEGGRWVAARDLKPSDRLLLIDGRSATVTGLMIRLERTKVYNLKVARLHNYAVGNCGVLVHNNNPCGAGNGPAPNNGDARPHGGKEHNDAIDQSIEELRADPNVENLRKNQTQTDNNGDRLDNNRPDVQYDTIDDGVHHNVEYDNNPRNSERHRERIEGNDLNSQNEYHILGGNG